MKNNLGNKVYEFVSCIPLYLLSKVAFLAEWFQTTFVLAASHFGVKTCRRQWSISFELRIIGGSTLDTHTLT
jgi:hypothetical protein